MALRWLPNRLNSQPRLSARHVITALIADVAGISAPAALAAPPTAISALGDSLTQVFGADGTAADVPVESRSTATASINLCTGSDVANNGTTNTRIEVSALANNSLIVRVDDTDRVTLTGVTGATTTNTTTNQRCLRAGIDHCDDTSTGPVTITHGSFATSQPPGSAHDRRAAN